MLTAVELCLIIKLKFKEKKFVIIDPKPLTGALIGCNGDIVRLDDKPIAD